MAKLVAGNWKSHGSQHQCNALIDGIIEGATSIAAPMIVAPAYPYLALAHSKIAAVNNIDLAAQNISAYEEGAYTGEVTASMVHDVGCSHVIIGHSERRSLFGDTNAHVVEKVTRAAEAGLIPIVCVGETLEERHAGKAFNVVESQVDVLFENAESKAAVRNAIIAYEPVWAIGTGQSASSEDAEEMHKHIRGVVQRHDAVQSASLVILYGGSVKPDTADELFSQPNIGGALVGGASLDAKSFLEIARVGAKF